MPSTSPPNTHTRAYTNRACISELSADERLRILPLLPRHSLEAVVGAFCDWQAHGATAGDFASLAGLVPHLDQQLHQAAVAAFPEMTATAWHEVTVMAAGSVSIRHELSKAIEQAAAGSSRRSLEFF
jgi:hypothetical protein